MKNAINNQETVRMFLETHAVAVLSTISQDNMPYSAAVYVVPDDKFNLYFITKSDTKKSRYILANHNAAVTIVDQDVPMTLQATGTVTKMDDNDKILEVFITMAEENIHEKWGFHWPPPLSKLKGPGALWMYKFEPNWMRLADFSGSNTVTVTKKGIFYQLIPTNDES